MSNKDLIKRIRSAAKNAPNRSFLFEIAEALEAHEWQPIATAPKEGTEILVYNGTNEGFYKAKGDMGVVSWKKQSFPNGKMAWRTADCCDGVATYDGATHWQPLPSAPEVE